jgi:hypothetical protein
MGKSIKQVGAEITSVSKDYQNLKLQRMCKSSGSFILKSLKAKSTSCIFSR